MYHSHFPIRSLMSVILVILGAAAFANPPVANDDNYTVQRNETLTTATPGVLSNDTSPQSQPLSAVLVSNVLHGSLTFNSNGSFVYIPAQCYSGSDSFTYKAFDGSSYSNVGTVSISIQAPISSGANQAWLARYNVISSANAMTVDNQGNVYVTGISYGGSATNYDYITIKYNTYGNQLWIKTYNGPGNGDDYSNAIAVDFQGNVYVTGASFGGSATGNDFATIKYDTNGNQLWVNRYDGPGNGDDNANAIVIDNIGNVYITGDSIGNGTSSDFATIKYNSTGNQQWVKRYNGSINGVDQAHAIALDNQGNLYITGYSVGGSNYVGGYTTIKYDINGNELWVRRYDGQSNNGSNANAIAVDGLGNVYVTGKSNSNVSYIDYATIKYNSSGNQQWVKLYDGPLHGEDEATAIAVDSQGNIFVTGYSEGANFARFDYATIKYDTYGNQIWIQRYNGTGNNDDIARSIAIDNLGNVYVTGQSYGGSATRLDYATIKYDVTGNQQWINRYDGPISGGDGARVVCLDIQGNIYVTGYSSDGSSPAYYFATIKYSQNNGAPVANSDTYDVYHDSTLTIAAQGVLSNDTDTTGDPLTATLVTSPSHGSITLNSNGSFVYIPNTGYFGTDSFTYKASNCDTDSFPATVNINVLPSPVNFTGKVKLLSWVGSSLPSVVVTIDNGTSQTLTLIPTAINAGKFTIPVPYSGTHSIKVKPIGFISQTIVFTTNGAPLTVNFFGPRTTGLIPGDTNNDGIIDDTDLLAVINNFLGSNTAADVNGDGIVDDTDLLNVINNFLSIDG